MVAKRQRRGQQEYTTADEVARAALATVPVDDEDPTEFWGPDFWNVKREIEVEAAAGRRRIFYSDEEFEAYLDQLSESGDDLRGEWPMDSERQRPEAILHQGLPLESLQ